MSDAGYTLAETLAALAILALAIGGLSAGLQVMARQQMGLSRVVEVTQARRAAQAQLDRLFDGEGPYRSHEPGRFSGGARALAFDCGEAQACTARLVQGPKGLVLESTEGGRVMSAPLRTLSSAHFVYEGAAGPYAAWPPSDPERQRLRTVAVVRDEPPTGVLLKTPLWIEQPQACQYDPVLQDCR